MKVALLTFHNALNYGAALQVYASQRALEDMGFDCEVIDYVNERRGRVYRMRSHVLREVKHGRIVSAFRYSAGSTFMALRRRRFKRFYSERLRLTEGRYTCSSEAAKLNDSFDRFIVGSDQVWNYQNNGCDFAFLLDFVEDDNKKVSYSSSFGMATVPDDLKDAYADALSRITHLSTRESYGVRIIKDLTGREAELVLDPVFLLGKEQWLSLCGHAKKSKKHIFCYTNRATQWEGFLAQTRLSIEEVEIHKLTRHLTVRDFLSPRVKVRYSLSPEDFIREIAGADLVVSASFHCVAMSIILGVPFVAVLTGDRGKDERIMNILRITGLEERILDGAMTSGDVLKPIDFPKVEARLEEYRERSRAFLRNSINA